MVNNTTIKISHKLKDYLIKNSVSKTQSYEDVIWMMLGAKTLTQQQKAEAKSNYEELL
jgi:flavoprotein|tara:strand:+ start:2007 stop:2180 length:174 start_codon:yes stop_codon:yes gene_type:complete